MRWYDFDAVCHEKDTELIERGGDYFFPIEGRTCLSLDRKDFSKTSEYWAAIQIDGRVYVSPFAFESIGAFLNPVIVDPYSNKVSDSTPKARLGDGGIVVLCDKPVEINGFDLDEVGPIAASARSDSEQAVRLISLLFAAKPASK